jgi:hypothetical protein
MAIHALTFVLGLWLFQQMSVTPSMWLGGIKLVIIMIESLVFLGLPKTQRRAKVAAPDFS